MHEFRYDYRNTEIWTKSKIRLMDTNSFVVYIKTEDIYSDISEDAETRFDASNCKLERPLPKWKKK